MDFSFIVNASVERTEGKFESRETIENALIEAIDEANPGDIEGENGGQYEVADWSVEEAPRAGKAAKPKASTTPLPASIGPGGGAMAPNITRIIETYVRVDALMGDPDEEIDALLAELKILTERFPHITQQAKAKFNIPDVAIRGLAFDA